MSDGRQFGCSQRKEESPTAASGPDTRGPVVLFVPSDSVGRGPAELGELLTGLFFHAIVEIKPKPRAVIFMNSGVKLVTEGSRAIEDLKALAAAGIDILSCGTCLGYLNLKEKVAVGRISNMYEIAEMLLGAEKVVAL